MKRTLPSFYYGGYHFTPIHQLSKANSDFFKISKHLCSDWQLGLTKYPKNSKFPWSYEEFYKAAGNCEMDLFQCEENQKIYIPCENELFLYLTGNGGSQL